MAGADTILRIIGAILSLFIIAFVTAVGFALMDPIFVNVIDPELMQSLGWGTPQNTVMMFAGLGFIGLSLTVIIWLKVAPVRDDVRQDTGPPL